MRIAANGSRRRRALLLLGVLLAVFAALALLFHRGKQPAPVQGERAAQPPALQFGPQDIARVTREQVSRTIPITGTLAPLQQAVVKTRAPGVLTSVLAREGERVKKGQLLARVDETEVRAVLAARQADVAAAEAQLDWTRRNLERQRDLLAKGFISENAFDQVKNEEAVASARLDAARAQAAQVRKSLSDQTLSSPIDGIVAQRHAQPGERLPADAPVLSVVALDRMEFSADVPTTRIAQVAVGQSVSVRVEGYEGRSFQGRVERINPRATAGAGVVPVYVLVDNPRDELRAGLFAHGDLMLNDPQAQLTVPAAAVHGDEAARFVYVVDDGRVRRRAVELAYVDGVRAVVRSGLVEGATVVAVNLGPLTEGATARLPAQPTASATPAAR
jgi:RND family efflux transporter MFP subunit